MRLFCVCVVTSSRVRAPWSTYALTSTFLHSDLLLAPAPTPEHRKGTRERPHTHTHTHTHVHAPNTTCTGACTCFHSCALLLFPSAVAARHWCEWAKQRGQWWCAVAAAKFHATVTHCGGHRCSKGESLFEMPHCVAQSGFASLVCSCNCTCSCHFTYSSGFLRWVP